MKIALLFALIFMPFTQNPASWQYSAKKVSDKLYEIHFAVTLEQGWHTYSQHQNKDAICSPTAIIFNKNPLITLLGKPKEVGNLQVERIETLGIAQNQFRNKVDFVQLVQLKSNIKLTLTGMLSYQVCTDEQCLPIFNNSFSVQIP